MAARPHRCPHTTPGSGPPPGLTTLRSTEAALVVIRHALGGARRRVVVLPLDDAHRGVRAVCVDHVPHDDAVLEVVELTLAAHRHTGGPLAALVVGSSRPGPVGWPTPDDWWRYATMAERCEGDGITLLDWLLVGDGVGVSMAELDSQPETRWQPG